MKLSLKYKALLVILLLSIANVFAQDRNNSDHSVEIDQIEKAIPLIQEKIKQYGAENVWIVWDIDHTVLRMPTDLGTAYWFAWQIDMVNNNVESPDRIANSLEELRALQNQIFDKISMAPVETKTLGTFNTISNLGTPMFYLTARPSLHRSITERELTVNGFSFPTFLTQHPHQMEWLRQINKKIKDVSWDHGVVMSGEMDLNKGVFLYDLTNLTQGSDKPKCLIVLDDNEQIKKSIQESYKGSKIDVVPILYTHDRAMAQSFDEPRKKQSMVELKKLLENKTESQEQSLWNRYFVGPFTNWLLSISTNGQKEPKKPEETKKNKKQKEPLKIASTAYPIEPKVAGSVVSHPESFEDETSFAKMIDQIKRDVDIFDNYADESGNKQNISILTKFLLSFSAAQMSEEEREHEKDKIADLILNALDKQNFLQKTPMRTTELSLINQMEIGARTYYEENDGGFVEQDYARQSEIFYSYIRSYAESLVGNDALLEAFIRSAANMSGENIEECLSAIFALRSNADKGAIYNYRSVETSRKTLLNHAIDAEVSLIYLRKMHDTGADFHISNDHIGSMVKNAHLIQNKENARAVMRYLVRELKLLPKTKIGVEYVETIAVALREFGFSFGEAQSLMTTMVESQRGNEFIDQENKKMISMRFTSAFKHEELKAPIPQTRMAEMLASTQRPNITFENPAYTDSEIIEFLKENMSPSKEKVWRGLLRQMGIDPQADFSEMKDPKVLRFYQLGLYVHTHFEIGSAEKEELIKKLWIEILKDFKGSINSKKMLKYYFKRATSLKAAIFIFGSNETPKLVQHDHAKINHNRRHWREEGFFKFIGSMGVNFNELNPDERAFLKKYLENTDLNPRDFNPGSERNSYLHYACKMGFHPAIIQMLYEHGFNMNLPNTKGETAFGLLITDIERKYGNDPAHKEALLLLLRYFDKSKAILQNAKHLPFSSTSVVDVANKLNDRSIKRGILKTIGAIEESSNQLLEVIRNDISTHKLIDLEKIKNLAENGLDLFEFYVDKNGTMTNESILYKIMENYYYSYGLARDAENKNDLIADIILLAFKNNPDPDPTFERLHELKMIKMLGFGDNRSVNTYINNRPRKHDYQKEAAIFHLYVVNNPSVLIKDQMILDHFVYLARQMTKTQIEKCLDVIFTLPQEHQVKIYNYYSNKNGKPFNTYNRTICNQASNAGVDVSYLERMAKNGADFTIQIDHFTGHDHKGGEKAITVDNSHIDAIVYNYDIAEDKANAAKSILFFIQKIGLVPQRDLRSAYLDQFIPILRDHGQSLEQVKEIVTKLFNKKLLQDGAEESNIKLPDVLATVEKIYRYKNTDTLLGAKLKAALVKERLINESQKYKGKHVKKYVMELLADSVKGPIFKRILQNLGFDVTVEFPGADHPVQRAWLQQWMYVDQHEISGSEEKERLYEAFWNQTLENFSDKIKNKEKVKQDMTLVVDAEPAIEAAQKAALKHEYKYSDQSYSLEEIRAYVAEINSNPAKAPLWIDLMFMLELNNPDEVLDHRYEEFLQRALYVHLHGNVGVGERISEEKLALVQEFKEWILETFKVEIGNHVEEFEKLFSHCISRDHMLFGGINRGGYQHSTMTILTQKELRTLITKHNRNHPRDKIRSQENYELKSNKYGYPSYGTLVKYLGPIDWDYVLSKRQRQRPSEQLRARPTKFSIESEKQLRDFILEHNSHKNRIPIYSREDWVRVSRLYGYMPLRSLEDKIQFIDWLYVTGFKGPSSGTYTNTKWYTTMTIRSEFDIRELIIRNIISVKPHDRPSSRKDCMNIFPQYGISSVQNIESNLGKINWESVLVATDWKAEFEKSPDQAAQLLRRRIGYLNQARIKARIYGEPNYPKTPALYDLPSIKLANKILDTASKTWAWVSKPEIDYFRINWLEELRNDPKKAATLLRDAIEYYNLGRPEGEKIKNYPTYPKRVALLFLPNEMLARDIINAAERSWAWVTQSSDTKGYWREQLNASPKKAYELLKKAWNEHVANNADAKNSSKYYAKVKDDKLPAAYIAKEILDANDKVWADLFGVEQKFEKINWDEESREKPLRTARILREKMLAYNAENPETPITNTSNYPAQTKDIDLPSLKTAKKVLDRAGKTFAWALTEPNKNQGNAYGVVIPISPRWFQEGSLLDSWAVTIRDLIHRNMDALEQRIEMWREGFDGPEATAKAAKTKPVEHKNDFISSSPTTNAATAEPSAAEQSFEESQYDENGSSKDPEDRKKQEEVLNEAKQILESSSGPQNELSLEEQIEQFKTENKGRTPVVFKGSVWRTKDLIQIKEAYNKNAPESEKITGFDKTWDEHASKAGLPKRSIAYRIAQSENKTKEFFENVWNSRKPIEKQTTTVKNQSTTNAKVAIDTKAAKNEPASVVEKNKLPRKEKKRQKKEDEKKKNNESELAKKLIEVQLKMGLLVQRENGKVRQKTLADIKSFETVVEYFKSQNWKMTDLDRATLKEFIINQQAQAARGQKNAQTLMRIRIVSELMDALYKDVTGKSLKEDFEALKDKTKANQSWFERQLKNRLGDTTGRVGNTFALESGKFLFALLLNTTIDSLTSPTVGLKEFIQLGQGIPHHVLSLASFSVLAGSGSTFSKLIADRVFQNSIEEIRLQIQQSVLRGSTAYRFASMQVGMRSYIRGQIGFIVGSILNGFLWDDYRDGSFWERQSQSIASFMIASAMVKGAIYGTVKIVEMLRWARTGTAIAAVNPENWIWQGVILAAELYVAPRVEKFIEKSKLQAQLEPALANSYQEYVDVLSGRKNSSKNCSVSNKVQLLSCLQNRMMSAVQQNWQLLTQYDLNREYQKHMKEFYDWENEDVASPIVVSTDNVCEAVEDATKLIHGKLGGFNIPVPSPYAAKKLYQTNQKVIALTDWRDIKRINQNMRVVIPRNQSAGDGVKDYFDELLENNQDFVQDMVSEFKSFNNKMTRDPRVRTRYQAITDAQNQAIQDEKNCSVFPDEQIQACKTLAAANYRQNLRNIINQGIKALNSTQNRVLNSKKKTGPSVFVVPTPGSFTPIVVDVPDWTLSERASPSEMLDLIFQMSRQILNIKTDHDLAVDQAKFETIDLLMMMYQELAVDVWQHIYFTDSTNPYIGQT